MKSTHNTQDRTEGGRANGAGFTLIELLVVVTIIVVLLALLIPAMDKAIYQAELLQCSTRQRAVTSSLIQYVFDHKRYYPVRGVDKQASDAQGGYLNPMQVVNPFRMYDVRPPLRGYVLSINEWLQCPFTEPIEMEREGPGVVVETSYMMLWGWQYQIGGKRDRGMFKLGDRFGVEDHAYSVLMADMDLYYPNLPQSSHPDRDPAKMSPFIWREQLEFGVRWNLSRWSMANRSRGKLDTSYAYDDGSVITLHGVVGWGNEPALTDERMDRIPLEYNGIRLNNLFDRFHVPNQ